MKVRKMVVACLDVTSFCLNGVSAALLLVGKSPISAEIGIRFGFVADNVNILRDWIEKRQ